MSGTDCSRRRAGVRRLIGLCSMSAALLAAQPARAQAQEQLSFFKNYFVTGDYVVRGVSLWRKGVDGKAVAHIPPLGVPSVGGDGVPARADIVAAFLYVQTAEKIQGSGVDHQNVHLKFNGYDFGPFTGPSGEPGSGTLAKALNWEAATPPCWSVSYPGGRRLVTYRADVLRFLPIDPKTGKQALLSPHRIEVPDWGLRFKDDDEWGTESTYEKGPRAIGASLVVVYRDRTQPFRGVVLYDGGITRRAYATMEQRLEGFYQASSAGTTARLTHIVGDGRWFLSERVKSGGEKNGVGGPISTVTNPFRSAQGPKWDNWTSSVPLPPDADAARVRVEPNTFLSDCTSWSAMVLSAAVQDSDGDGLLDEWETNSGLVDPNGQRLPDLAAMGANHTVRDLFVEVGYMKTDASLAYGPAPKPAHTHLPSADALQKVADAFDRKGIKVHFDVGNNYQDVNGARPQHVIPWSADAAINLARGGEAIDEMVTVCAPVAEDPSVCQFSAYPGTVGWKSGFRVLRDQVLAGPPPNADGTDPCDATGNSCVRRFDRNRKDVFHYALFAHALGMPKDPCFVKDAAGNLVTDANGNPISDLSCNTPDFHVPRTNSGIADFPGGDLMVTLGAFDDTEGRPVGTDYMQAATLMHELGHNFELTHAGRPAYPVREPNCKPNYLSVMNYLFQLRGLLDAAGVPQLDYSSQVLGGINEIGLSDAPFPSVPYRTGWYAPLLTSYLNGFAPAATKHCDGSELLTAPDGTPLEPQMVRVDSLGLAGDGIDWNADGLINSGGVLLDGLQDVNFNGQTLTLNPGADDWSSVRFDELGGRRSVGGFFEHDGRYFMGPLSLDVGRGDIGRGDIGRGDIGRGDIGRGDIGRGDIGRGDIGRGDIGRGDIGRGDIGRGDIGRGDIGRGDFGGGDMDVGAPSEIFNGELDFETFIAATGNAPTPANALQACLTDGESRCVSTGGSTPVRLSWLAPNVGRPIAYQLYRFDVGLRTGFPPATLPSTPIATVTGVEGPVPTTYLDRSAANGASYAYFVVALFDDGQRSGVSNFATIATPAGALPPPVLLSPIGAAQAIAQNDRATECPVLPGPDASRGRGYRIAFDWQDVESPSIIAGYRIVAMRTGADTPLVDQFVEGSAFTHVACNAFVDDRNLTGWEWRVQAQDLQGRTSEWSDTAPFEFQSCVLDDGETPCHVPEAPSGSGGLSDPAGDAGEAGNPDLVSGSVVVQEEFVSLRVRFAPGTFDRQTSAVQFSLDTDQNAATGHQGTDSGCGADNGVLGVEYIVDFGSAGYGTQAVIRPFVGPACNSFGSPVQSDPGTVTYLADGFDVVFPRSFLGGDDGFLNFKVVSYRYIGEGFSGVVDRMTDAGEGPGVVIGR